MQLISSLLLLIRFPIGKSGALPISGLHPREHNKVMVHLHGRVGVSASRVRSIGGIHKAGERPADPTTLMGTDQLKEKAQMVHMSKVRVRFVLCVLSKLK